MRAIEQVGAVPYPPTCGAYQSQSAVFSEVLRLETDFDRDTPATVSPPLIPAAPGFPPAPGPPPAAFPAAPGWPLLPPRPLLPPEAPPLPVASPSLLQAIDRTEISAAPKAILIIAY